MRIRALFFVSLLPFSLACSSSSDDSKPTNTIGPNDATHMSFSTGEFEIKPGDNFECFYTATSTDRELSVVNSTAHQDTGGHHVVAYWTDVARDPQHHPCVDSEMVQWHQIAGAGGDGKETLELPDGFGLKVPAGKQLVIQSHYINTTASNRKVSDNITLVLAADPSTIKNYVNYLATDDESFQIAAKSPATSITECTLERDFDMISVLPHMHEWGKTFELDVVDASGNPTKKIMSYDSWSPSFAGHPPVTYFTEQEPLHLTKGSKLRQTCTWENDTTDPIVFPREMCLSFFYYFPGVDDVVCNMVPVQ